MYAECLETVDPAKISSVSTIIRATLSDICYRPCNHAVGIALAIAPSKLP